MNKIHTDILSTLKTDTFLTNYSEYLINNIEKLNAFDFLHSIEINKEYYKLNICKNINDLKIKNINGHLNKLTNMNHFEIYGQIKIDIDKNNTLLSDTIYILIDKCILQKKYIEDYLNIFINLLKDYSIQPIIYDKMKEYDNLFITKQSNLEKSKNFTDQYLQLCEKNKRCDNYIGYCELIYHLEKNNIIKNKFRIMVNNILNEIDTILNTEGEQNIDEIFNYINSLNNIYSKNKSCPEEIKIRLKSIKSNIQQKKIIFKIMDILEL